MKISMLSAVALVLLAVAAPVSAQTGDLKIRFQYGGDPPAQGVINPTADAAFCGNLELKDERLIVNPETKGIQNVIVAIFTGRGGSQLPPITPAKNEVELANKNCRFEPRVVVAQVGDTLRITNPDPIGHNANLQFFNNEAKNPMIPPNQEVRVELTQSEPGLVEVRCNIHPWMKALLLVLDHPFAGVTDENGDVIIKDIPVGKHVFRVNHESGRIQDVSVNGKNEEWSRSRVELEIKPGMNDLGTVVLPAASFSAN